MTKSPKYILEPFPHQRIIFSLYWECSQLALYYINQYILMKQLMKNGGIVSTIR